MAKQTSTPETKLNKKSQPQSEQTAVAEQTPELVGLSELLGGSMYAAGNGQGIGQAARLGDTNLQTVQRQAIAKSIARMQGNLQLQKSIGNSKNIITQRQEDQSLLTDVDPQRALAQRIRNRIQKGTISVATYVTQIQGVDGRTEFRNQARQYASDHGTIGIASDGRLREGVAMEINDALPNLLQALISRIDALFAAYPDLTGGASIPIPINRLAIFTHGDNVNDKGSTAAGLQAGNRAQWIGTPEAQATYAHWHSLEAWVERLVPLLSSSPRIILYACLVGGKPPTGLPFAEALQAALQAELKEQRGPNSEVNPEVWGHTTAGHTTRNPNLVEYRNNGASSDSVRLRLELQHELARLAIERSNGGTSLTQDKRRKVVQKARRAINKVIRKQSSAETRPTNPINSYFREIPHLGIDRVCRDISVQATPDFSDLGLSPEAVPRVAQGLHIFQTRFARELAALVTFINSI